MKKILLTTAIVGAAFTAAPAMAEVQLGIGGHMKGYVTYIDQDEAAGLEARSVDILRETEIHFTGETTLDNGLTVGFHSEVEADGGDGFEVEESYAYFAGNWGRVNFGAEDGAAYLLQVAAPSADSNVDGIRQYVSAENYGVSPGFAGIATFGPIDYDQAQTGYADKLTYITPVFNGFQAGASYTPDVEDQVGAAGNFGYANAFGVRADDVAGSLGDAWEVAGRYEGQFNAVRMTLGAGYTMVSLEEDLAANDDNSGWNVGAGLGFGAFNVGAIYLKDKDFTSAAGADTRTWVVGADYTNGPWVLGASYYDRDLEGAAPTTLDTNRYSGGVTYTYGPGMTFRGSVHHIEHEVGVLDMDSTSLLLGTQINF